MKFKKERKVLLIIVISAAMAVISMFMTDNSDKLFCSIERPEPGEETQVKRINVVGEDGESITSVDVEIAPRIMSQDEAAVCFEKAYEEIAGIMCGRNKNLEHVTSNLVLPETAQRGVADGDGVEKFLRIFDLAEQCQVKFFLRELLLFNQ